MRSTITQFCNGVRSGQTYNSDPHVLDKGNSSIFASSLFVHLDEHGKDIAKPKDTDDKIVIGYTKDGMAFQIVVDGFYGGDSGAVFTFIDYYVIPLIDRYSADLGEHPDSKKITESLIRSIYSLRSKNAPSAEFTMSMGVTYKKGEQLFCAGFGIGDTGIVIKRNDGTIEQLVCHTEVDGFKDAFDEYSSSNIGLVIQRNSIFDTPVMPGDELVGYTYIPPELEVCVKTVETETENKGQVRNLSVKSLVLDAQHFNNQSSLFSQLLDVVQLKQEQLVVSARNSGALQRFGDDYTVGCLVIPDTQLMHQLKVHALLIAVNDALRAYIAQENSNKGFMDTLGIFTGTRKNIEQATLYKNLIATYHHEPLIFLIILSTMISHHGKHPMTQYLVNHLECPSKAALNIKLDELILKELEADHSQEIGSSSSTSDVIGKLRSKIIQYINDPLNTDIDSSLSRDYPGCKS